MGWGEGKELDEGICEERPELKVRISARQKARAFGGLRATLTYSKVGKESFGRASKERARSHGMKLRKGFPGWTLHTDLRGFSSQVPLKWKSCPSG